MSKLRVAVLRGGPSNEYDRSLKTGSSVLTFMPEKYHAQDIFISKDGIWHINGAERSPDRALQNIDVALNALHGTYCEDGKIQQILKTHGIPFTGSESLPSAISMNKILSKKVFEQQGIKSPYAVYIEKEDNPAEVSSFVFHHFLLPFVVKPATTGSARGVTIVKKFVDLQSALDHALSYSDRVIIEEFIRGREVTVGIIDNFRNHERYRLLPVEIHNSFTSPQSISNISERRETNPGVFSSEEKNQIEYVAKKVHDALGLRHYSHIDMIVTPRRGIYVLEANTHPAFDPGSRFHQSLEAVGCTLTDFLDHIIQLARM